MGGESRNVYIVFVLHTVSLFYDISVFLNCNESYNVCIHMCIYHRLVVQLGTLRTPFHTSVLVWSHSCSPILSRKTLGLIETGQAMTIFAKPLGSKKHNTSPLSTVKSWINQWPSMTINCTYIMCQFHSISPHLCSFLLFSPHLFLSLAILHQVFFLTAVKLLVRMRIPNHSHKNEIYNVENRSRWWFQPIWKILVKLDHFPK